jgi:hypothetical protein
MTTSFAWTRVVVSGCVAIAAFLGGASPLIAQTSTVLFVATNSDFNGSGCGARERPCRSISRAIRNAMAGNLIEVGPGIYDADHGDAQITIDKAVEIYSTAGAALTIIRASQSPFQNRVVRILANGATFGRRDGGFTITGSKLESGVGTEAVAIDGSDVTVAGNVALGHEFGFLFGGAGDRARLDGNIAVDNAQMGFQVFGFGHVLTGNIANGNSIGFLLGGDGTTFTGNVAIANKQVGVQSQVEFGGELIGNTVIGNGVTGMRFPLSDSGVASPMFVHQNNIFGNGDAAVGCGIVNEGGGFIDATDNYWGKATGPGPNPGDRAHGDCTVRGSTQTTPFATAAFPIEDPSAD